MGGVERRTNSRRDKSPVAGRRGEAIRKDHRDHLPVLDLCFLEPNKSTRVCHDAYSQPYFGAWRGNAPTHAEEELRYILCHGGVICRRQKASEVEDVVDEGRRRGRRLRRNVLPRRFELLQRVLPPSLFETSLLLPALASNCHCFPRRLDRQIIYPPGR
jgi:hypothetical protein